MPSVNTIKKVASSLFRTPPKLRFYFAYFYKYAKVHPRRMLFESFNGKSISDSSYAVLQEMMRQGLAEDYEVFYATNNPRRDQAFVDANKLPVTLVNINSRRYTYVLATAKYLLGNVAFPAYFIRKPEQVYIQTWHGTPLKTLGKQMRCGMQSMFLGQHNFLQANMITFPNNFTRDVIMRDYNLDQLYAGKIVMVGYPRNAVFLQDSGDESKKDHDPDAYTTFAYMPTWRGTSSAHVNTTEYAEQMSSILSKIDASLTNSQRMYVNFHTMVASKIELGTYEHIFPFPTTVNTYDFLAQMDVLITDYSSVLFDFALTKRPIALFCYDEETYVADRGMYLSLDELPFPVLSTVDELCDWIQEGRYAISDDAYGAFHKRFLKYDSPDNARDVLSLLLGHVPEDLDIHDCKSNAQRHWNIVDAPRWATNEDLDRVFAAANRCDDLIVINQRTFGEAQSIHMYERYLDYTFVFTTHSTPATLCELVAMLFSRRKRQAMANRELDRLLGIERGTQHVSEC